MWRRRTPDAVELVVEAEDGDESKKSKYARLNVEADRELTSEASRRNAVVGRASTLVGAASIGASVSAASTGLLNVAAAVAFLIAAVLGVIGLWPRSGKGLDLEGAFRKSWAMTSEQMELSLLQVKLDSLNEEPLFRLANLVRAGFVLLTIAILLLAVGAGVAATKGDPMSDKTPAPNESSQQAAPPREADPDLVQIVIKESGDKPTTSQPPRETRRG